MEFLIDGYNLMHAIGLATKAMSPKQFERNRDRFLTWLATTTATRDATFHVIFDALHARRASTPSANHGILVTFALGQTADEYIAELVASQQPPHSLAVVTNDMLVRDNARRRGCRVYACSEFVDWLQAPDRCEHTPATEAEKPDSPTNPEELSEWLAAFTRPRKRSGS